MNPHLIIVNGIPGTGKTTLARKLSKDLDIPLISKDDIKELFFDKLGVSSRDWSRYLGKASVGALFLLVEELLKTDRRFMIENAFWAELARDELAARLQAADAQSLELYCHADEPVRKKRFVQRMGTAERHPGHVEIDHTTIMDEDESILRKKYAPLQLHETIKIDLTEFDTADYRKLLHLLRGRLG